MHRRAAASAILVMSIFSFSWGALPALPARATAAERQWQIGKWTDVSVKRQMFDFGPGASPFGRQGSSPSLRAMADVRIFVIETDNLRIEIQDVVPIGRRSVDAEIGEAVTFALDKNTIYVKGDNGIEHRLRVTRKTQKPKNPA